MIVRLLSLATVMLSLTGCGGEPAYVGPKRIPLSGKVTLDGAPLSGGTISFLAIGKGNPAGGQITAGTYSIPEEQGANAGSHRVEIRWSKPTGEKVKDADTGGMIDVFKEAVPAKFNEQSELKAEVSADKKTFDFDLSSK
ncbi:MAG: hypothetical protein ACKV2Q_25015 [Planctomycetaceae bacterium]